MGRGQGQSQGQGQDQGQGRGQGRGQNDAGGILHDDATQRGDEAAGRRPFKRSPVRFSSPAAP